jgi:acetyl esterase/lipase
VKRGLALMCAVAIALPVTAQPTRTPAEMARDFTFKPIAAPAEPGAIPLYAAIEPGSETSIAVERWNLMGNGQRVVRNVVRPTITPFLPDPKKATGAAVIVAPGGGFKMLAMDNEGWPVARWLASQGIAAFVLKYRINETPADEAGFMREMSAVFAAAMSGKGGRPDVEEPRATADALQALKMVRAGATKWRIDPARVGMIGFSAGAMTTLNAARVPDVAARPSFIGYIYGPMTAIPVPPDAPAMFAALALDDGLFGRQGFGIVESWKQAGRPVELHAYERGDHGFGMGLAGTTTTGVMPQFRAWLESRRLLTNGSR